jgi:hypothetical protein
MLLSTFQKKNDRNSTLKAIRGFFSDIPMRARLIASGTRSLSACLSHEMYCFTRTLHRHLYRLHPQPTSRSFQRKNLNLHLPHQESLLPQLKCQLPSPISGNLRHDCPHQLQYSPHRSHLQSRPILIVLNELADPHNSTEIGQASQTRLLLNLKLTKKP